jgi:phage repressor protein C with HTH and peptisase S24 domain
MSNARERLLELSRQSGTSLAGLSDMIGRNPTYLQQFIRKGSPRRLEERDRRLLADFFGIAESELGGAEDKSYTPTRKLPLDGGWVDVPRLSLAASAGPGAVSHEEAPFDNFRFSRRWLREQGLDGSKLSAIAVEGDSMEPLLRAGDEVLVDHAPQPFRDGIHVVRLDDTLLVKRVAAQGGGRFTLLSQNLAYPPIEVGAEDIEIVGRVVWKSGRL